METAAQTVAEAQVVTDEFVAALAARDRAAVMRLYAPEARFEAHVPGGDPAVVGPGEIGELLQGFFIGRDDFRVIRSEVLAEGGAAALNFDLTWRTPDDDASCLCFQSHTFAIEAGKIRLQRMYCAGVRVFPDPA
jgi:ketosteroid isomerase-like protein